MPAPQEAGQAAVDLSNVEIELPYDKAGQDETAFLLAHGHPLLMTVALIAAGMALRFGLTLRRQRAAKQPPSPELRRKHLRIAKPAALLMLFGLIGGPASAWLFRGWEPFGTLHAALGTAAALLFGITAWDGRALEGGDAARRQRHGWIALAAFLMAAVSAVTGFVLLP